VVRWVAAISAPILPQWERLDVPRDRRRILGRHDQPGAAAGIVAPKPMAIKKRLAPLRLADEGAIYPC
jgi:hypothetical protein